MQKHTVIHTEKDFYNIPSILHNIEIKLSKDNFCRCHRSYIVSFYHIRSHDNTNIIFDNGERAYIGRRYFSHFKSAFQDYIARYNLERF